MPASEQSTPPPTVAVCICTFRRPLVLDALLARLGDVVGEVGGLAEVSLVVVDDSPDAEARDVVGRHGDTFDGRVTYVVTAARNISVARNEAMDRGTAIADFVAFIDDDCLPDPRWLRELVSVQRRFGSDIVTGHCRDIAAPGAPSWFLDEPWIAEADPGVDGTPLEIGPLKNSLFSSSALRDSGIRFDEEFGRSGGEDALFFLRANAAGLTHVHAAAAVVEETGPLERITEWYQFRRALWYGNTEARTVLAAGRQGRARLAASSAKRILSGPMRALSRAVRGEPPQWRWSTAIALTGVGRLLGTMDVRLLHSTINRRRDGSVRRPLRARTGRWVQPRPGMFSVVIPTLQQSPHLHELISTYCDDPLVCEVVVVNNAAPAPLEIEHPKLVVVDPGTNIYVNPAWNLGVQRARGEYLVISNDDLVLPPGLLNAVASHIGPRVGVIGPHHSCFEDPTGRLRFRRTFDRPYAFGTLMFLARSNYVPIPDDLRIWHGDDWLFGHQSGINYTFHGVPIGSPMSTTAGQSRFDEVKRLDGERYLALGPDPGGYRARTRWERGIRRRLGLLVT